jgi:hypothetical protein
MIHHVQLASPPGTESAPRLLYRRTRVRRDRQAAGARGSRRGVVPGIGLGGAAGYPVIWDDDFPGLRRLYSEDVHGNRLEFLSPHAAS